MIGDGCQTGLIVLDCSMHVFSAFRCGPAGPDKEARDFGTWFVCETMSASNFKIWSYVAWNLHINLPEE